MAPNDRKERRLARQRGAGPREIKDVAFNFSLGKTPETSRAAKTPQPLVPRASSRKTPAAASNKRGGSTSKSKSKSKTPVTSTKGTTSAKKGATRSASAVASSASRPDTRRSATSPLFVTPVVAKNKRKREQQDHDSTGVGATDELGGQNDGQRSTTTKSRRLNSGKKIQDSPLLVLGEDELDADSPEYLVSGRKMPATSQIETSPTDKTEVVTARRNSSSMAENQNKPAKKITRRPRTPLGVAVLQDASSGARTTTAPNSSSSRAQTRHSGRKTAKALPAIHEDPAVSDGDELSFSREESSLQIGNQQNYANFEPDLEGTQEDTSVATSSEAMPGSVGSTNGKPLRKSLSFQMSRKKPSQGEPRRKKAQHSNKQKNKPASSKDRVNVTVYRRSRRAQAETDPLGATSVPSFNPADVMAQIILEISSKYITASSTPASRQRRLLHAFHNILQDSLFDISAAQNAVHALTGRLRTVKRESGDKRAEILSVKKDREEIARKMDNVRSKHTRRAQEEEERGILTEGLHDLDIAIQRGRERMRETGVADEEMGASADDLLNAATQLVKSKGLIGTVQIMNAFLDGAASKLEGY